MPPKSKLFDRLYNAVGVDKTKTAVKLVNAPPVINKSSFKVFMGNIVVQADLIYMPENKGKNFILTVVDVASRACDAEPLAGRTAEDVCEGFDVIFKRKNIKPPKYLYTDPGTEFKNEIFHDHMKSYNVIVRHSMTARKNQMGIVEYYNHIITKVLGTKMTSAEIESHEANNDWVDALPLLITELNKEKREQTIGDFLKMPIFTKNEKLLEIGDYVHVRLQQPKDTVTGQKLNGNFRNGDQKFDEKVSEISFISIRPGQPVRYTVNGMNNVTFLRSELLLADDNEIKSENDKKNKGKEAEKKEKEAEDNQKRNFKGLNIMELRNRKVYME